MRNVDDIVTSLVSFTKESVIAMMLTDVVFGTVVSLSPLEIKLDQKGNIFKENILLTRNSLDYDVEMSVDGGQVRTYRIFNGLKVGERLALLQAHGGQMYIVIDKVVQ